MKKRHLFWIIPSGIVGLALLVFVLGHLFSPVKTKRIPERSKDKKFITEKELKKDLSYLKYYFENLYVAYDFMKENGFDVDAITNEVLEKCKKDMNGRKEIDSQTFLRYITTGVTKAFKNVDMHFGINGSSPQDYRTVYFSDIFIRSEQVDGTTKYFVYKNEREEIPQDILKNMNLLPMADIKIGGEYTGSVNNLYEYFDGSESTYRYCVFTDKRIKQANISIDGETVIIPVMPSISISNSQQFQGFKETKDSLYISMSDFVFSRGSSDYEEIGKKEFQSLCDNAREKSKGKKNIIIDLRNNGGGSPIYRNAVFANLMYNQSEISEETIRIINSIGMDNEEMLFSPVTGKFYREGIWYDIKHWFRDFKYRKTSKTYEFEVFKKYEDKMFDKPTRRFGITSFFVPQRKYFVNEEYVTDRNLQKPDFQGNVYILTNRYSASCSEYSLAMAYIFDKMDGINVYHIGENTCGAVSFVNPCSVVFPYSGGWMYIPTAWNKSVDFNHPKYKGESYGWYPDYWSSSINLLNTLNNLIEDPELTEVLKGLERHHL